MTANHNHHQSKRTRICERIALACPAGSPWDWGVRGPDRGCAFQNGAFTHKEAIP